MAWTRNLTRFYGPSLFRVLDDMQLGKGMPSIAEVLEALQASATRSLMERPTPPEPTKEERERSDKAAILSMLWLHYAKNWPLWEFKGHILARQFGDKDPQEALKAAKELYDKDLILAWMVNQQQAGN